MTSAGPPGFRLVPPGAEGWHLRTMREVDGPSPQNEVQVSDHFLARPFVARPQHRADFVLEPLRALPGWTGGEIHRAVPAKTLRAERVAEEIELLAAGVLGTHTSLRIPPRRRGPAHHYAFALP